MKVSNVPVSAKYSYDPYAVRFLGGCGGIFIVLFAGIFRLTHHACIVSKTEKRRLRIFVTL
jgi:hypothetical protein